MEGARDNMNRCYLDCVHKLNFGLYKPFFILISKHPEHEKESVLRSYNVWISPGYYVLSFSFAYFFHTVIMERAIIEEL